MVIRIRKGTKPRVFLREWRKYKKIQAVKMAARLEIERESYYRLEREWWTLSVGEVVELADALGIEPNDIFRPPPEPNKRQQPSVDAMLREMPEEDQNVVIDLAQNLRKRSVH